MTTASHAIPGPHDITRTILDNGMTILVRENHSAPVAVLEGLLPVGAVQDPPTRSGLSSFVAGLLTRGSRRYDFATFNETIESIGASLDVGSDTHVANFGAHGLSEDFGTLVEVLADVLRHPTFPAEQVELVRNQKLIGMQEREEDTRRMANVRFYEAIYGEHPYARPVSGYPEPVAAISREDLARFHTDHYTPHGAIIVVSGDVQTDAVLELLDGHLGDWSGSRAPEAIEAPKFNSGVQQLAVPMPGKIQSDIMIGVPATARSHPDFYAVRVANTILGQFGLMGRLGETVREQQGLAYYCYSMQDANLAGGLWLASAGVNPANVDQAVAGILHEFQRLGDEGVGADELDDSQAYMTGVLPLTLETNEGVATALLTMEQHGLGLDYLLNYRDLIYGVTADDVQRVARQYLGGNARTIVVAGPQ